MSLFHMQAAFTLTQVLISSYKILSSHPCCSHSIFQVELWAHHLGRAEATCPWSGKEQASVDWTFTFSTGHKIEYTHRAYLGPRSHPATEMGSLTCCLQE